MKQYWLLKSEPFKWSWAQQQAVATEPWDGVRNYQARNFMMRMKKGDEGFFYHSNKGKEIVGIVTIEKEYYADPTDATGTFVCVDVAAKVPLKTPVSLAHIKGTPSLKDMALLKQARLSVSPVTPKEWNILCQMGGVNDQ